MDAKERTRLRALCEAATPGPWDAIYDEDAGEWTVRTGHADVAVLTWQQALDALGLSPVTMRTAAIIAASRTAIPALLDDSERLDAVTRERDEARAALATARREGAEEMRWAASEAAESWLRAVEEVTQDSPADLADTIRALPLDAPGGAPDCTGITAQWCPRCGDCTCPWLHEGHIEGGRTLNDPKCPLHAPSSPHGDAPGGAT